MSISSFNVPQPYAQPLADTERDEYNGGVNVTNIDFDPDSDSSEAGGGGKPKWTRVNL